MADPVIGADGVARINWLNESPIANLRGNSSGFNGGMWGPNTPLAGSTAGGTVLSGFNVSLYSGGWAGGSAWTEATATDNTLEKSGWNYGHMANASWGPTTAAVSVRGLPDAWATAGYDIYVLAGNSQTTLSWIKMTDVAPLTTVGPVTINGSQSGAAGTGMVPTGLTSPAQDWRMAAIQILKISTATPASFSASPASPLDFGNVDVSTASTTQTVTLTNNGDTAGDVTGASITGA
ncbi:MAG: hypothetical protein NT031_19895, partial [Planctomycetota bacterium]|nr:hypothetical protein [Planctomycetota bacterium]